MTLAIFIVVLLVALALFAAFVLVPARRRRRRGAPGPTGEDYPLGSRPAGPGAEPMEVVPDRPGSIVPGTAPDTDEGETDPGTQQRPAGSAS